MKYCKNCGTKLNDEDKFCPNCGFNQDEQIEARVEDSRTDSSLALAGFITSLVALIFSASFVLSIVSLILSIKAYKETKAGLNGKGLAVAGIIISITLLVIKLISIIFMLGIFNNIIDDTVFNSFNIFDDSFEVKL